MTNPYMNTSAIYESFRRPPDPTSNVFARMAQQNAREQFQKEEKARQYRDQQRKEAEKDAILTAGTARLDQEAEEARRTADARVAARAAEDEKIKIQQANAANKQIEDARMMQDRDREAKYRQYLAGQVVGTEQARMMQDSQAMQNAFQSRLRGSTGNLLANARNANTQSDQYARLYAMKTEAAKYQDQLGAANNLSTLLEARKDMALKRGDQAASNEATEAARQVQDEALGIQNKYDSYYSRVNQYGNILDDLNASRANKQRDTVTSASKDYTTGWKNQEFERYL